jgi:putative SOS response-associated peptidase YedK
LVPYWTKDIKVGFANINAMAETVDTKSAFREALQRRRCLVPVDSFYEWKRTATGKQPYAIALADRRLMALAGLWENWRSPAGEGVRSFAIITTKPNELCAELHNRMPVVLQPTNWPAWLGEESADARQLKVLLGAIPADEMTCWPVSPRVGNVKNNDPALIDPITLAAAG